MGGNVGLTAREMLLNSRGGVMIGYNLRVTIEVGHPHVQVPGPSMLYSRV